MNLTQMTSIANNMTDENFSTNLTLDFANEGIAEVNTKINATLPYLEDANTDYTALPEAWIRKFLITYICYCIKRNDSSLGEADRFERKVIEALDELDNDKSNVIDEDYQGEDFDGVYKMDLADAANPNGWW